VVLGGWFVFDVRYVYPRFYGNLEFSPPET
jgi:hypothetical protein